MKLFSELKVPVCYGETDIFVAIKKKYGILKNEIERFEIVKESIDSRRKPNVFISLNIAAEVKREALKKVSKLSDILVDHSGLLFENIKFSGERPVVVGFGPSGIFAGLSLALAGLKPIILEQGKSVYERQSDVDEFWKNRKLNPFSNVQFGEGGAGTFSDGKLASNVNNSYTKNVINEFILAGAPSEIFYSGTPHIGSDRLKVVVTNLRKKIESLGGEVWFNTKFVDYNCYGKAVNEVVCKNIVSGEEKLIKTSALILAVGHSAEDVYNLLYKKSLKLEPKPFAMGVRIEGLQSDIDFSQYGKLDKTYPPANYKLVTHLDNGRSVFTFCMCPGGQVVASSSQPETVVTNGMSLYSRSGENANSAVLVNVVPEDFKGENPLAGVHFQRKYERLAFELGGRNYSAPAEMVGDFLKGIESPSENLGRVKPTYLPGIKIADLKKCLPDFVYKSLVEALPKFNQKIKNFAAADNLLIGIESRSSSPVTIVRDENFMACGGLFVCGEGAGYAGGITSSGADGIRCAEKVIEYLKAQKPCKC